MDFGTMEEVMDTPKPIRLLAKGPSGGTTRGRRPFDRLPCLRPAASDTTPSERAERRSRRVPRSKRVHTRHYLWMIPLALATLALVFWVFRS